MEKTERQVVVFALDDSLSWRFIGSFVVSSYRIDSSISAALQAIRIVDNLGTQTIQIQVLGKGDTPYDETFTFVNGVLRR